MCYMFLSALRGGDLESDCLGGALRGVRLRSRGSVEPGLRGHPSEGPCDCEPSERPMTPHPEPHITSFKHALGSSSRALVLVAQLVFTLFVLLRWHMGLGRSAWGVRSTFCRHTDASCYYWVLRGLVIAGSGVGRAVLSHMREPLCSWCRCSVGEGSRCALVARWSRQGPH